MGRTTTPAREPVQGGGTRLLAGVLGFVLVYLAVGFVVPSFASTPLPLPNAPAAEARTWYAGNQLAAVLGGVL